MDAGFRGNVDKALTALRRRNLRALGQSELVELRIVQQRLPRTRREALTEIDRGEALRSTLIDVIKSLKPLTVQEPGYLNQPEWRHHIALDQYVVHGRPRELVAGELGLRRSAFYECRSEAVEDVARELWQLEQDCSLRPDKVQENLPHSPYTEFVERRDAEGGSYVERIIDALTAERAWLVIIDGPAGVGKTALAYRVADECIHRELFDAVVWVSAKQRDVSPEDGIYLLPRGQYVTSLDEVLDSIGKTVRNLRKVLTLPNTKEKQALVRELLLTTNCLIVIDNLEELTDDAFEQITGFLRTIPPPTKGLLTSRERHYIGEIRESLLGMEEDEAIKFMQLQIEDRRLRCLSGDTLRLICRRTQGVPLAMKYALGQIEVFGHSVQDAVGSDFQNQDLLDYMFERAYRELEDAEKKILHLASVFVEPASSEAIRIAGKLARAEVKNGLRKLHQLFLVDKGEQDRWEVLPYVRRFLDSIREEDDDLDGGFGKDFTCDAFVNLSRYYTNRLQGQDIDAHLTFLKREKANALAVLGWCYENREAGLLIDLAKALGRPLGILGYEDERLAWGERAMEMCDALGREETKARFAVMDVAWAHIRSGRVDQAKALLEEYLALSQERGYLREMGLALHNLGRLHRNIGNAGAASRYLAQALQIWSELGDKEWRARSAHVIGRMEYEAGDHVQAHGHLEEARQLREEVDHENEIVETMADLALVLFAEGNEADANQLMDEALFRGERLPGPGPSYALALFRDAEMHAKLGNMSKARKSAVEAYRIYESFGVQYMADRVGRFLSELDEKN